MIWGVCSSPSTSLIVSHNIKISSWQNSFPLQFASLPPSQHLHHDYRSFSPGSLPHPISSSYQFLFWNSLLRVSPSQLYSISAPDLSSSPSTGIAKFSLEIEYLHMKDGTIGPTGKCSLIACPSTKQCTDHFSGLSPALDTITTSRSSTPIPRRVRTVPGKAWRYPSW